MTLRDGYVVNIRTLVNQHMQMQIHSKVSLSGVPVSFQAQKETLIDIDIVTLWHSQNTLISLKIQYKVETIKCITGQY